MALTMGVLSWTALAAPVDLVVTREETIQVGVGKDRSSGSIIRIERVEPTVLPAGVAIPDGYKYEDLAALHRGHWEWIAQVGDLGGELGDLSSYKRQLEGFYNFRYGSGASVDVLHVSPCLYDCVSLAKGVACEIRSHVAGLVSSAGVSRRINVGVRRADMVTASDWRTPDFNAWPEISRFIDSVLSTFLVYSLYLERGLSSETQTEPCKIRLDERIVDETTTTFVLPEGATDVHLAVPLTCKNSPTIEDFLASTSTIVDEYTWHVPFGGGSYLEATARVEGQTVILEEELVVTGYLPDTLLWNMCVGLGESYDTMPGLSVPQTYATTVPQALLQKASPCNCEDPLCELPWLLGEYAAFWIEWQEPSAEARSSQSTSKNAGAGLEGDWQGFWKFSWRPAAFSKTWSWSKGDTQTAGITTTVGVGIQPKVDAEAGLGWEFGVRWLSWYPAITLEMFKAGIEVNPSATLTLDASLTAKLTKKIDLLGDFAKKLSWSRRFCFSIGPVPVWINVEVSPELKLELCAEGEASFFQTTTFSLGDSLSASVSCKRDDEKKGRLSWEHGLSIMPSLNVTDQTTSAEAVATASATLPLEVKVTALVYDVAGPSASVKPFAKAEARGAVQSVQPEKNSECGTACSRGTLNLSAHLGLSVSGNVTLAGWLADVVGCEKEIRIVGQTWPEKAQWAKPLNAAPCPPSAPQTVSVGCAGQASTLSTCAIDAEKNALQYKWRWRQGKAPWETSPWGPQAGSGVGIEQAVVFPTAGRYEVQVCAKDTEGNESAWSDPLVVTVKPALTASIHIDANPIADGWYSSPVPARILATPTSGSEGTEISTICYRVDDEDRVDSKPYSCLIRGKRPFEPLPSGSATCSLKIAAEATTGMGQATRAEGTYTLAAYAVARVKDASQTSSDVVRRLKIDAKPPGLPGIELAPPANPQGWQTASVTVAIAAKDSGSGIAGIHYALTREGSVVQSESVPYATWEVTIHDEGEHTLEVWAEDRVGNVGERRITSVKIDKTAPEIRGAPTVRGAPTTTPNENCWYSSPVTVEFTCRDEGSGIAKCPAPESVWLEGIGQTASARVEDRAGNSASCNVIGINIDRSPPRLEVAFHEATDGGESLIVSIEAMDDYLWEDPLQASGVETVTASDSEYGIIPLTRCGNRWEGTIPPPEDGTLSISAGDRAGNTTKWSISCVAPRTEVVVPTPGSGSLHSGNVRSEIRIKKGGSIVETVYFEIDGQVKAVSGRELSFDDSGWASYAVDVSGHGEHTLEAWAVGEYGLESLHDSKTFLIDEIAPIASVDTEPRANQAGWSKAAIKVTASAADTGDPSGVSDLYLVHGGRTTRFSVGQLEQGDDGRLRAPTQTLLEDGIHEIVVWAVDQAGNRSATARRILRIDRTPPTIQGGATRNPNENGWHKANVTVHFECTDAVSGIASCSPDQQVRTEGANQSVSGTAIDNAGNKATKTVGDISIDKTEPCVSVSLSESAVSQGDAIRVVITAIDSLSGIDSVSAGDSHLGHVSLSQSGDRWQGTIRPSATGTVSVEVVDRAGNRVRFDKDYELVRAPLPAQLEVPATALDFGEVAVGSTSTKRFALSNSGEETLEGSIRCAGSDCGAFDLSSGSLRLGGGEKKTVTVDFRPGASSEYEATIEIESNGGTHSIQVSGRIEEGSSLGSQIGATSTPTGQSGSHCGIWPDRIVFFEEANPAKVLRQMADGDTHLYGNAFASTLYQDILDYGLPVTLSYGSFNTLLLNPAVDENDEPFFHDGRFNAFGIQKVREAMYYLIDRNHIVEEILNGLGVARWTMLDPNFPPYAQAIEAARALELKYQHDEAAAADLIREGMEDVGAALEGGIWTYNGDPVGLIGIIRTEDERRDIGDYFADLLEGQGFTVERVDCTSAEASPIWLLGEPNDGEWSYYTGGWISDRIDRDQSGSFDFHYTPRGWAVPLNQGYPIHLFPEADAAFDRLARRDYGTIAERVELLGIAEEGAFECAWNQWIFSSASPEATAHGVRVASDLAAGVSGAYIWAHTARFVDADGAPVVGGTLRMASPSMMPQPWNPVAGSGEAADTTIQRATEDWFLYPDPNTGLLLPHLVDHAECYVAGCAPMAVTYDYITVEHVHEIYVPADAWCDWDAANQQFITVGEKCPDGSAARTKTTITYVSDLFENLWHDGSVFSFADMLLTYIVNFDLGKPDSLYFDEAHVAALEQFLTVHKGLVIESMDPLTVSIYDDRFDLDAEVQVFNRGRILWPYYSQGMAPWHTLAVGLKAEAAQTTVFSESKADALGVERQNWIAGEPLHLLLNELEAAQIENFIPYENVLGRYVTRDEAYQRYDNVRAFLATYGHLWIGNGPMRIESVDPIAKIISGNRFEDYRHSMGKFLALSPPRLADVEVVGPDAISIGEEATFDVAILEDGEAYPAADIAEIKYLVLDAAGELAFSGAGVVTGDGAATIALTAADTARLVAGSSRIEVHVVLHSVAKLSFGSASFSML